MQWNGMVFMHDAIQRTRTVLKLQCVPLYHTILITTSHLLSLMFLVYPVHMLCFRGGNCKLERLGARWCCGTEQRWKGQQALWEDCGHPGDVGSISRNWWNMTHTICLIMQSLPDVYKCMHTALLFASFCSRTAGWFWWNLVDVMPLKATPNLYCLMFYNRY
jgi:hypothetical protein